MALRRYVLPLTASTNGYQYFACPQASYITVQVINAGVDIGFGSGYPGAIYPPNDEYYALASATLPRACDEIRYKSHVANTPAQVQITAQGEEDLPSGIPLGPNVSPNFLTIDAQGRVSATFTGVVNAQGLNLQAAASSPGSANYINWKDVNGALVASLLGQRAGSPEADSWMAWIQNSSYPAVPTGRNAYFKLNTDDSNDQLSVAQVAVISQANQFADNTKVIIDANGNSDFVKTSVGSSITQRTSRRLGAGCRGYSNAPQTQGIGNVWKFMNHVIWDPDGCASSAWFYPIYSGVALATFMTDWAASAIMGGHCELWDGTTSARVEFGPTFLTPSTIGRGGCMAAILFQCQQNHGYAWQFALDSISSGTITTWNTNEMITFQQVA